MAKSTTILGAHSLREFVIRWVGNAAILMVIARAMSGSGDSDPMQVNGLWAAMIAVALVSVFNVVFQPLCRVVTAFGCLVNLLSLGVFGWVVSFIFWALAFYIVGDWLQPMQENFQIHGFHTSCIAAFWMAVGNGLLNAVLLHPERDAE